MRNFLLLGITGGLACGKSEVGTVLEQMGFVVCDADRVAHQLMGKGMPIYQQVVAHFGSVILAENGEISRAVLGKLVFENSAEREVLNALVHPAVSDELRRWMAKQRAEKQDAAVLLPLLFESGMETLDWDAIGCVSSSEELVFERLEKRGFNRDTARIRIEAQLPLAEKMRRSDFIILNNGTIAELKQVVQDVVKKTGTKKGL
jgi:dephospho-CoA kinase